MGFEGAIARRRLLAGAGWVVLLAGCSTLTSLRNPFGPRTIEIPQEQLFAQLSGQFPFNRRLLEFFDVTVSAPRFALQPQDNRISTELEVRTGPTLLLDPFKGKLGLSYGLRLEPSDNSVRLADVRIETFSMDGVPDAQKSRTGRIGGLLAEELLNGFTVYRFKPEDLKNAVGLGYKPGAITVTARGLALTLEPTGKL